MRWGYARGEGPAGSCLPGTGGPPAVALGVRQGGGAGRELPAIAARGPGGLPAIAKKRTSRTRPGGPGARVGDHDVRRGDRAPSGGS